MKVSQLLNLDCQSCGACCAYYRVSFYNGECDFTEHGMVPTDLVNTVNPFMVCMSGTQLNSPRCVALSGVIGTNVSCTIYEKRSSACRNFEEGSEACAQARLAHGIRVNDLQIA